MTVSAHAISSALGGKKVHSDIWLCHCPVPNHGKGQGDKSPSLSIKDFGNRLAFTCFAGCLQDDIIDELKRRHLWNGASVVYAPKSAGEAAAHDANRKAENEKRVAFALLIWNQTLRARGTLVDKYLNGRGITLLPDALRFHPSLVHTETHTRWPAMVAGVRDVHGSVTAIHRTYLARDGSGKAPINPSKMTLGPCGGNAIWLAPPAESLMVAEGIETALSVMQETGHPTWAAGSAEFVRSLVLPKIVKKVTLLVDNDQPGHDAANKAAARWQKEKRRVLIAKPPQGVKDFNDLLLSRGEVVA